MLADKSDGEIGFGEVAEVNWRNNLRTFKELVWPVLQEEGLSNFDIAYQTWTIAMLNISVEELKNVIEDRGF